MTSQLTKEGKRCIKHHQGESRRCKSLTGGLQRPAQDSEKPTKRGITRKAHRRPSAASSTCSSSIKSLESHRPQQNPPNPFHPFQSPPIFPIPFRSLSPSPPTQGPDGPCSAEGALRGNLERLPAETVRPPMPPHPRAKSIGKRRRVITIAVNAFFPGKLVIKLTAVSVKNSQLPRG